MNNLSLSLFIICLTFYSFKSQSQTKEQISKGAEIWADTCTRCHNVRDPSDFADDEWAAIMAHMRVRSGITGDESRYILYFLQKNNISESKVINTDLSQVDFSLNSSKGDFERGKEIYSNTCIGCHGENGKGEVDGAPDFTSNTGPLKKEDLVLMDHIWKGFKSPGGIMDMPARGGNEDLKESDLADVVYYIRALFEK